MASAQMARISGSPWSFGPPRALSGPPSWQAGNRPLRRFIVLVCVLIPHHGDSR